MNARQDGLPGIHAPKPMVEEILPTAKTLLNTRPIYHKRDETIRGTLFSSFLALVLRKELEDRVHGKGHRCEWADVLRDLDGLQEVVVEQRGKRFVLRTEAKGTVGKVFQAVGVALPPTVRQLSARRVNATTNSSARPSQLTHSGIRPSWRQSHSRASQLLAIAAL